MAISCLNSLRWSKDPRQEKYLNENKLAADRGVVIHRIFVLNKETLRQNEAKEIKANIREQIKHKGIKVDVVWSESLSGFGEVEDWVYFSSPKKRLYIDYPDNSNRTHISHADLIYKEEIIDDKINDFRRLLSYVITENDINSIFLSL